MKKCTINFIVASVFCGCGVDIECMDTAPTHSSDESRGQIFAECVVMDGYSPKDADSSSEHTACFIQCEVVVDDEKKVYLVSHEEDLYDFLNKHGIFTNQVVDNIGCIFLEEGNSDRFNFLCLGGTIIVNSLYFHYEEVRKIAQLSEIFDYRTRDGNSLNFLEVFNDSVFFGNLDFVKISNFGDDFVNTVYNILTGVSAKLREDSHDICRGKIMLYPKDDWRWLCGIPCDIMVDTMDDHGELVGSYSLSLDKDEFRLEPFYKLKYIEECHRPIIESSFNMGMLYCSSLLGYTELTLKKKQ
ncbi:MAG: hypothetical protein LBB21_06160 [Holosporaceae bacterium]|jgi:hypothetical protein|nr:hypothetical protein [Holosporaceae bacterium]